MPSTLTPAGALIKSSWQTFVKTWSTTVRYSAWLLLPSVLTLLEVLIPRQDWAVWTYVAVISVISVAVALWVSVCLYQTILALESGAKVTDRTMQTAWAMILPLVLVGVLQGLATLGAFMLLVLPGIYVGVRLGFSQVALFQKGTRGRAALAESWALTKDRFWAVLWRQLAGGVVFGLVIMIVATAAILLVGYVAGGAKVTALLQASKPDRFASGLLELVQSLVQAAFIPLLVIFQVKLFKTLEKTRA